MTEGPRIKRVRGSSPRGDFETAKASATSSEEERIAANRRKSKALEAARLAKEKGLPSKTEDAFD